MTSIPLERLAILKYEVSNERAQISSVCGEESTECLGGPISRRYSLSTSHVKLVKVYVKLVSASLQGAGLLMPPTIPINHYGGPRNHGALSCSDPLQNKDRLGVEKWWRSRDPFPIAGSPDPTGHRRVFVLFLPDLRSIPSTRPKMVSS